MADEFKLPCQRVHALTVTVCRRPDSNRHCLTPALKATDLDLGHHASLPLFHFVYLTAKEGRRRVRVAAVPQAWSAHGSRPPRSLAGTSPSTSDTRSTASRGRNAGRFRSTTTITRVTPRERNSSSPCSKWRHKVSGQSRVRGGS